MASTFSSYSEAVTGKLATSDAVTQLIQATATAVARGQLKESDYLVSRIATLTSRWEQVRDMWFPSPGLALQAYEEVSTAAYDLGGELAKVTGANPVGKPAHMQWSMPWWGWLVAAGAAGILLFAYRASR